VAGDDGTNGTNGQNAYTTTTASFNMPNGAGTIPTDTDVTISVVSSAWAGINQIIFINVGAGAHGHFKVISKPTTTSMTVRNLEDGTGIYSDNSAPATTFASGATVQPAGLQGLAGASSGMAPVGATYITQTPDGTLTNEQALSALATGLVKNTTATGVLTIAAQGNANTNVPFVDDASGLTNGESLFATATGIESKTAANARTALGLALGTNVQAQDAFLQSIANLGTAANKMLYTTGVDTAAEADLTSFARSLLDDTTANAAQVTLDILATNQGRIALHTVVDLNAVGDTGFSIIGAAQGYIIDKVVLFNATINITTAQVAFYTGAGATGTTLALPQAVTGLAASTNFVELTLEAVCANSWFITPTLYLRVTTAQGAPALCAAMLFGRNLV
jgi:hypothetical protein